MRAGRPQLAYHSNGASSAAVILSEAKDLQLVLRSTTNCRSFASLKMTGRTGRRIYCIMCTRPVSPTWKAISAPPTVQCCHSECSEESGSARGGLKTADQSGIPRFVRYDSGCSWYRVHIFPQPLLVSPHRFRVGQDFFRREPKLFHLSLTMQPRHIVKVGRGGVLGFAIGK